MWPAAEHGCSDTQHTHWLYSCIFLSSVLCADVDSWCDGWRCNTTALAANRSVAWPSQLETLCVAWFSHIWFVAQTANSSLVEDLEELSEEEEKEEEEQELETPEVKLPVKRKARARVEIEYETEQETPIQQKMKI